MTGQRVPLSSDLGVVIFLGSAKGFLNANLKYQQVHGADRPSPPHHSFPTKLPNAPCQGPPFMTLAVSKPRSSSISSLGASPPFSTVLQLKLF